MSHYSEVTSSMSDEESLIEACKDMWPDATILQNARVRGWPRQTAPEADVVVRFTNPTEEKQGNYDIGFKLQEDGTYRMVGDWYAVRCVNDEGKSIMGQQNIKNAITGTYTVKVAEKAAKRNPRLRGFKNVSTKGDYIVKKNSAGKDVRYKRVTFVRGV